MRKRKPPKYSVDFIRLINDGDDGIMEFRPPVNTNFLAVALLIQLINCIRRPNRSFKVYISVFYDYIDYDKIKQVPRYKLLNLIVKEYAGYVFYDYIDYDKIKQVPRYKLLNLIVKDYAGYLLASVLIALLTIILICSAFDIRLF